MPCFLAYHVPRSVLEAGDWVTSVNKIPGILASHPLENQHRLSEMIIGSLKTETDVFYLNSCAANQFYLIFIKVWY